MNPCHFYQQKEKSMCPTALIHSNNLILPEDDETAKPINTYRLKHLRTKFRKNVLKCDATNFFTTFCIDCRKQINLYKSMNWIVWQTIASVTRTYIEII